MKWLPIIIAIVIIGTAGVIGGYYLYQNSLQPNIQVTAINIATPDTTPDASYVDVQERVSGTGWFDYTATLQGEYYLIFDNSFSWFTTKWIYVYYTFIPNPTYQSSFGVSPFQTKYIQIHLWEGQHLYGNFSITGGSNDIDFRIQADTCTELVSFSFTLVNAGSSDGFADVIFTVDGNTVWTNKYFVTKGSSLPISDSITIKDCGSHTFNAIVQSQNKP